MSQNKARGYDKEFKLNAVTLCIESGKSCLQIAKDLGIPNQTLATWVALYKKNGDQSFPGKGHLRPENAEMSMLRKVILQPFSGHLKERTPAHSPNDFHN